MPDLQRLKITTPGIISVARWNETIEAIESATVTSFVNGGLIRSKGGTTLVARKYGAEGGTATSHPFQVLSRPKPDAVGVYQYGVIYQSSLFKSLRPNDKQAITGLLSEDRTSGWFDLSPGGYIWLGIVFNSSGEVTNAVIDNSDENTFNLNKNAWSGMNGYCEDDGGDPPFHQASRKLIAYTVSGDTIPILTQVMFRDQILQDCNIDGRPARYPFPHEGGYPF